MTRTRLRSQVRLSPTTGAPRPWTLLSVLALAGVVLLAGSGSAAAQDLARGRQLYQLCAVCHGASGEGSQERSAPAIGGLPRWYVEAQIGKFKQDLRGYRAEDTAGLQMRPMARALMTGEDVAAVAAYAAALQPARPAATLKGDAGRGQATYAACAACHGPDARGNQALGAPPLGRQADWYMAAQIKKFRQGLRGASPKDAQGTMMRAASMALAEDQAIADVMAYVRSLGQ